MREIFFENTIVRKRVTEALRNESQIINLTPNLMVKIPSILEEAVKCVTVVSGKYRQSTREWARSHA